MTQRIAELTLLDLGIAEHQERPSAASVIAMQFGKTKHGGACPRIGRLTITCRQRFERLRGNSQSAEAGEHTGSPDEGPLPPVAAQQRHDSAGASMPSRDRRARSIVAFT